MNIRTMHDKKVDRWGRKGDLRVFRVPKTMVRTMRVVL